MNPAPPGAVDLVVDTSLYEKEAVTAASLRCSDRFSVSIQTETPGRLRVTLLPLQGADHDPAAATARFWNDLLDEQVRLEVHRRTGALREIVYRHAFEVPSDSTRRP